MFFGECSKMWVKVKPRTVMFLGTKNSSGPELCRRGTKKQNETSPNTFEPSGAV